ncbi:oligopeptide/dipeptide ABC transporter ATP-binding protein [Nocardioides sp. YIM 152315]|uniref:ABC transporter ATP-binding protein n=1 Tax=Nocardioides sp. YIM 152315 TaxID=3031760 RepID=UPI0023DBCA99|nr:oligopeptide/dipeptide ABC transporter ATP-binding protein [Nocardioides sp. YIM 152315]MDF1604666.1 ATP-binding cassette domain-containing protein [Nocardioides sp. YIM 152315]
MSRPGSETPLLRVRGLEVSYRVGVRRHMAAVRGIDLDVRAGEVVALVGESGSGKSSAARGILQLTRPSAGTVELSGQELTAIRGRELRRARRDAQMVFQDPYSSLDPSMTIGEAIAEPLVVHTRDRGDERRRKVVEMLERVGLHAHHADRYPHEFSGGQRQRIAIARALVLRPRLLVADESVSALDVSSQNQVLSLLSELIADLGLACLFITHDLAVVRSVADRVAVMYLGTLVEQAPTEELFAAPRHPYTAALLSAALVADPRIQRTRERIRLSGELPDPRHPPTGCAFAGRCPYAAEVCGDVPALRALDDGRAVACHRAEEVVVELGASALRTTTITRER